MYKTYKATVEFNVQIRDNGLIVQTPESVSAAVRHFMRTLTPVGWRRNGMLVEVGTIHAVVEEKETVGC
jgi:hypothetical protein